jgi:paired small multidrug resistance pump
VNLRWPEAIGLLGVVLILLAYFLLQVGRLRGNALPYQLLNAVGALLLLVSLFYAFNLSAFLMESAWLFVSIYGIVRNRRRRT